jgi:hypothetical protein
MLNKTLTLGWLYAHGRIQSTAIPRLTQCWNGLRGSRRILAQRDGKRRFCGNLLLGLLLVLNRRTTDELPDEFVEATVFLLDLEKSLCVGNGRRNLEARASF